MKELDCYSDLVFKASGHHKVTFLLCDKFIDNDNKLQ
jgi:hypothetical protein